MAKVHDKFVVELAEVIKGYGNPPDVNDPFCLSEFYRFYEIPNVCISADNFIKMRPLSDFTEENVERGRWVAVDSYSAFGGDIATWDAHGNPTAFWYCSFCREQNYVGEDGEPLLTDFCPHCGADMREETHERL